MFFHDNFCYHFAKLVKFQAFNARMRPFPLPEVLPNKTLFNVGDAQSCLNLSDLLRTTLKELLDRCLRFSPTKPYLMLEISKVA